MVRIVSGVSEAPEYDSGALLRGFEKGAAYRQRQQAAQQDQIAQALRMKEIQMRFEDARSKREQALAQAAQMGDAKAIQTIAFEHKLKPSENMLQMAMKMRQGITDPKALAEADAAIGPMIEAQRHQEKVEVAQGEIERAAKDGLIDPETGVVEYQARLQSGEQPDNILKEFSEARMKRSALQSNMDDNAQQIAHMDAAIAAMPEGRQKRLATIAANEYKASPSLQEKEGSGAKVRAEIQKIGIGELSQYDAIKDAEEAMVAEKRERALAGQRSDKTPAPGLEGMTAGQRFQEMEKTPGFFGQGGPKVPAFSGGTHATVKGGAKRPMKPEAVRQVAQILAKKTNSPKELVEALQAQGLPLTEELAKIAREALTGRRTNAQPAGNPGR